MKNRNRSGHKSEFSFIPPVGEIILAAALSFFHPVGCVTQDLESELRSDLEDHQLDRFSRLQTALILSEIDSPDSLAKYIDQYRQIVQTLQNLRLDPFDNVGSAEKVFAYLHGVWIRQYQIESTTLLDIFRYKKYNCVAGTILYNLVCDDLGLRTEAFETPTHVYTIFTNFTEQVAVENTSPMGFNIMKNLKEYSRNLARYYPENQALKIGLDRLYAYENSRGRRIDNTELLGLLAYNRAYLAKKASDFERAFNLVLLAQLLNRDSRSNIPFEIGLYSDWGKTLFEQNRLFEAFEVFAGGCIRHPDIKDFSKNAKVVFFRAADNCWMKKDWPAFTRIMDGVLGLNLLDENEANRLKARLENWAFYFFQTGRKKEALQAVGYLETQLPENPETVGMKKKIENMP